MNNAKAIQAKNKALRVAYTAVIIGMVRTGATIPEIKHVTGLAASDIEAVIIENKLSVKPGVKEKNKFVIWDVLVWDGNYLVGSTFGERLDLLENILPCQRMTVSEKGIEAYDHLCCTQYKGIYKAPTYTHNFVELYRQIVKTDLYEGLVLKKKDSKLTFGMQELNNHDWQVKCRKETKNYAF